MFAQKKSYLFILAIPVLFFCLPLLLGYAWNSAAVIPGIGNPFTSPNIFNNPEEFTGRHPNTTLSIDERTGSSYNLPYDVNLRYYLSQFELPLWNPFKGLGVPLSSQSEGSPYHLFNMFRAIIPGEYVNIITFIELYISGVFLFLFLKNLKISNQSAYIGSFSYIFSGAFTGHFTTTNIIAALSIATYLLWALEKAIRKKELNNFILASFIIALQIFSGHLMTTFVVLFSAFLFCLFYINIQYESKKELFKLFSMSLLSFLVGLALSAFIILPTLETIQVAHNTAHENLGQYYLPFSNLLYFIFPYYSGHIGDYWPELHAFLGLSPILAILYGISPYHWNDKKQKNLFYFFLILSLFWISRYTGLLLFEWVGSLPFFSKLSIKHSNGFLVLSLCIASAISIENLKQWRFFKLKTSIFLGLILVSIINPYFVYGLSSKLFYWQILFLLTAIITTFMFFYCFKLSKYNEKKAVLFLLVAISWELILYVSLGNREVLFTNIRYLLYVISLFLIILFDNNNRIYMESSVCTLYNFCRRKIIFIVAIISFFLYGALIYFPQHGLPSQYDFTKPPKEFSWLKKHLTHEERTLGIHPDYQLLSQIQNIDMHGPFPTDSFANFAELIEYNYPGFRNGTMNIAINYELRKYLTFKAFFDWVCVRYLFLENSLFEKDQSLLSFFNNISTLRTVHTTQKVTIMESINSTSRAYFAQNYEMLPKSQYTREKVIYFFKNNPEKISQLTILEDDSVLEDNTTKNVKNNVQLSEYLSTQDPIKISQYTPNLVRLELSAHNSGVVVLKDAFYPGWTAYVNGNKTPIFRANLIARAVKIDRPGTYNIVFKYYPKSFINGLLISGFSLLLIICALAYNILNCIQQKTKNTAQIEDIK